ncbi:MAG: hypothetical protein ABI683_05905 [Ginsengibacter sp.]
MTGFKISLLFTFYLAIACRCLAQYEAPLYTSYTTKAAREKMRSRMINYTINRNLSLELNDSTEEKWEEAFGAIELMLYKSPISDKKIYEAFGKIENRSIEFQRSLIEVAYSVYPLQFNNEVDQLLTNTNDPKLFAMCAEYLLADKADFEFKENLLGLTNKKFGSISATDPILYMLKSHLAEINGHKRSIPAETIRTIFSGSFLHGKIVMYSIQRKNRDYPGMVVVRNASGNFVRDSLGQIITVPQLARSLSNMPGYISNGNTPQGIFLMYGFGVSMSSFIGPSVNVQMGMPFETSIKKFLGDSSIYDSAWTIDYYKTLIPKKLQNYGPLYYSYYSGEAGRSEIIAHGTTVDPNFYLNQSYYPLTPSQGCLCTREIWDGKRIESDQQQLVNALLKAGGANGYCVVIELNDKESPVMLKDILPYLR